MQSTNQHKLSAYVVKNTEYSLVLKAQEQQKEKEKGTAISQASMNIQSLFPGGWIKYHKSGYQGL